MAMPDFLIPSGEIVFHGDLEQLLHTIIRVDGVLMKDQRFRCVMTHPEPKAIRFGISKGRFHFTFSCQYHVTDSGFLVSYRVYPGFFEILLLLFPFFMGFYGCLQFAENGKGFDALLLGFLVACVIGMTFFWARKSCIRRFWKAFDHRN